MNFVLKVSSLLVCVCLVSACGGGSSSSGSGSERSVANASPITTGIPTATPDTRQGVEFLAEQCIMIDRSSLNGVVIFNTCDRRIITRDFFPLGVFENRIYPIEVNSGIRFFESDSRRVPQRVPSCFSPYVPAGTPTIEEYSCLLP